MFRIIRINEFHQSIPPGTDPNIPGFIQGYPALRNAIVEKLKKENGLEYTAAQISCANGAKPVSYTHLNIINELGVYGKGGINKFDDLFSVIRKKYLSWLAQ